MLSNVCGFQFSVFIKEGNQLGVATKLGYSITVASLATFSELPTHCKIVN